MWLSMQRSLFIALSTNRMGTHPTPVVSEGYPCDFTVNRHHFVHLWKGIVNPPKRFFDIKRVRLPLVT